VGAIMASIPASILISGKVPHLGAIVEEFKGQTDFLLASVHAKNKFVIFKD
jgi:hypothetical protein